MPKKTHINYTVVIVWLLSSCFSFLFGYSYSWSTLSIRDFISFYFYKKFYTFWKWEPSGFEYEWNTAIHNAYIASLKTRIKRQVMHRLSCLFEFKSEIYSHWPMKNSTRTHLPEKKSSSYNVTSNQKVIFWDSLNIISVLDYLYICHHLTLA